MQLKPVTSTPLGSHMTKINNHGIPLIDYFFCTLLALCTATGSRVLFSGTVFGNSEATSISPITFVTILVFFATFFTGLVCTMLIRKHISQIEKALVAHPYTATPRAKLIFMLLMILCWSPYLLALYPGVVLPDALSSFAQISGTAPLTNHHPLVFTLLLGLFVKAPLAFDINAKVFLFTLFQTTLLSYVAAQSIIWMHKRGLRSFPCFAALSFFCLCPVFPIYAANIQKDVLFAIFCVLLSMRLISWDGSRKQFALLLITLLLVALFRSNGILVTALAVVALAFVATKQKRLIKITAALIASFFVAYALATAAILSVATPPGRIEALGVPLQQLARVVVYDENITQEDKEFMNSLLPLERYKECYTPALADSIKWAPDFSTDFLSSHTPEFLALWLRCLPTNFGTYIDAYLLETFGFWAPGYRNAYGYMDDRVEENDFGIVRKDLTQELTGGSIGTNLVEGRWFISTGTLLWLVLGGLWLTIAMRNFHMLLIYIPPLASFLSILIATPVAFSLRYVFALALGLPLYLLGGALSLYRNTDN